MLSLEKIFKEKLLDVYRQAPLDIPSFKRPYRVCKAGECLGMCCNGGVGFYMNEEADALRTLAKQHRSFFEGHKVNLPEQVLYEEVNEETGVTESFTETQDAIYPQGLLPSHFPSTACVFKREDGACTLQLLSVEQGKPSWWHKPLACWLYPLELEYSGKPFIHVAHASTDEYVDEEYPGFVGFTKCGMECANGGEPAYKVLAEEIKTLSNLLERDLLGEITAQTEAA